MPTGYPVSVCIKIFSHMTMTININDIFVQIIRSFAFNPEKWEPTKKLNAWQLATPQRDINNTLADV